MPNDGAARAEIHARMISMPSRDRVRWKQTTFEHRRAWAKSRPR